MQLLTFEYIVYPNFSFFAHPNHRFSLSLRLKCFRAIPSFNMHETTIWIHIIEELKSGHMRAFMFMSMTRTRDMILTETPDQFFAIWLSKIRLD